MWKKQVHKNQKMQTFEFLKMTVFLFVLDFAKELKTNVNAKNIKKLLKKRKKCANFEKFMQI
jgi:hypothetical protein